MSCHIERSRRLVGGLLFGLPGCAFSARQAGFRFQSCLSAIFSEKSLKIGAKITESRLPRGRRAVQRQSGFMNTEAAALQGRVALVKSPANSRTTGLKSF
jgi:hypothetical protein